MAYALYVLARAGRAPVGDLKYLTDTKLDDFGSPLARAQVAAALSMLGDRDRADTAFASAIEKLGEDVEDTNRGFWRADYGSVLRDASAILALATDAKAKPEILRTAMSAIEVERARTRYASTQEMSWMVLAARAVIEQSKTIALDVGGSVHNGTLNRMFRDGALEQDVRVTNKGDQPVRMLLVNMGAKGVKNTVERAP